METRLDDSKPVTFLVIRNGGYVSTTEPAALELTRMSNEQGRVLSEFVRCEREKHDKCTGDRTCNPRYTWHLRRANVLASMALEV